MDTQSAIKELSDRRNKAMKSARQWTELGGNGIGAEISNYAASLDMAVKALELQAMIENALKTK